VLIIFVYDAFWYTGVLHLMLMALNRYINICRPNYYGVFFTRRKTGLFICLSYLSGILVAAPTLHPCCYLYYDRCAYAALFTNVRHGSFCDLVIKLYASSIHIQAETHYVYVDLLVNGLSVVVMIVCYTKIILRVRRSRMALEQYKLLFRQNAQNCR